ncbi:MAG: hypothetical protein WBV94_29600 [Blastocatellia bacterium]
MITSNESGKRERWLSLGRFRVPSFLHSTLLEVQREYCHSQLRDSAIFLMSRGVLSLKRESEGNAQVVTNGEGR